MRNSWHTRPRVQRAPGIPCALSVLRGTLDWQTSGKIMPRDRGRSSFRGARAILGARKRGERSMGRKIAIVGAGAVGGYAGAHMVQAGEDVTFVDPWPEHVEHMKKHGLRVTHAMDVAEFSV